MGMIKIGSEQKVVPSMHGEKAEHRFGISTLRGHFRPSQNFSLAKPRTTLWSQIMAG